MDGLQNLSAGLGDNNDKRSFSQYVLNPPLQKYTLESMFMSSWLAARIVTTPADDMTRAWVDLSWDGHDDDQEDDQAIHDAENDLDVRNKFNEALQWARLYGGSAMVIGLRDQDLATPLNVESVSIGDLTCLLVYDRWWISADPEVDLDANSSNFGMPLFYRVSDGAQRVHWTRVIRFNGRKLPKSLWMQNQCWDGSELGHVLDNVKDYDAVRASIASMAWEANVDILKVGGLADLLSDDAGAAIVQKRFQLAATMKSFNRMLIIDKDTEDFQQKTTSFGGLKDILDKFILDVSGAASIPVTRLFGQSPAGLNATGDSDTRNYYDQISAKQQTQLRAQLYRMYQVLVRSVMGRFPDNFKVTFRPLWQVSAVEKATIEKTKADRDAIYVGQGVVSEGVIARQLKADNVYPVMENADVELAVELALPPPQLPPGTVPPGKGFAPKPAGAPRAATFDAASAKHEDPEPIAAAPDKIKAA